MQQEISSRSKRVAKNTLLLYFRMLLLMFIGLFTSRIVLQNLGVTDYGIYNAVAGVVSLFSIITAAIGSAMSRFLNVEIGKGDSEKLKRVFLNGINIQILLCLTVVILAETLGLWFLNDKMDIPVERMTAANWVFQSAVGVLVFNLISVPYTSVIMAHEQMKPYALISLIEASLKLLTAVSLAVSVFDKLKTFSILMLITAVIVRMSYTCYCKKHFAETRVKFRMDLSLWPEIGKFIGWNAVSSGLFFVNTQGLNILTNVFFGVAANAARGIAVQLEGIVKQFVNNVVIAINPQITQSYASGDRAYSYTLVSKSSKYAYLIMLFFIVPAFFEIQTFLEIWLGTVPDGAAAFTKLALVCSFLDLWMTTSSTIILADGRIQRYYGLMCLITAAIFPLTWLSFRLGAPAEAAYYCFIAVYVILDIVKLIQLNRITGYPVRLFFNDVVIKVLPPTVVSVLLCYVISLVIPDRSIVRMLLVTFTSSISIAVAAFVFSMTKGERSVIIKKIRSDK